MTPKNPLLQGAIGAVIGFVGAIALEFVVLLLLSEIFHGRMTPRGLGWIVIPILAAIGGWRFGKEIGAEAIAAVISSQLEGQNRYTRLWLAGSILWLVCALTFYIVFNPYGSYWSSDEWKQFWLVLSAPPVIAFIGLLLIRWANKPDTGTHA
jgi:hypothetical protein